jgi:hypothetical protein
MPLRVYRSSLDELARYADEERKRVEAERHAPARPLPSAASKRGYVIEIVEDEADSTFNNPVELERLREYLRRRAAPAEYAHAS